MPEPATLRLDGILSHTQDMKVCHRLCADCMRYFQALHEAHGGTGEYP